MKHLAFLKLIMSDHLSSCHVRTQACYAHKGSSLSNQLAISVGTNVLTVNKSYNPLCSGNRKEGTKFISLST